MSRLGVGNSMSLHAIGLWKATVGAEAWEESVLKVDDGLAHFLVPTQQVVVIDGDLQVLVMGEEAGHLKGPGYTETKQDIQLCFYPTQTQIYNYYN